MHVGRFVFASTIGVYAFGDHAVDESAVPCPATAYAASKLLGEFELAGFRGLPCAARLATIYGPGDRGNFARLHRLLARRPPWLPGDPAARKSVIHVDDAAAALLALAMVQALPPVLNVSGPAIRLDDAVRALAPAGSKGPRLVPPPTAWMSPNAGRGPLARRIARALESLGRSSVVDTARLARTLPSFVPRDPRVGLREAYR